MATDIVITDVTNGDLDINNDWVGTGVFDVLMNAVNKNIDGQYIKGRITGSDYANVYLGAMQAVLAQSVDYVMKEKVTESQIDNMAEDTKLKYVERVIKDKQSATMGMDNIMKLREASKVSDANYVYIPAYEEVV